MPVRKVVRIDEEKCDGCGLCVPACAEGAVRVIDGKARLVNDAFCDGLGACLGECPQGAIEIVEREAIPFDEAAVAAHLARTRPSTTSRPELAHHHACPGSAAHALSAPAAAPGAAQAPTPSALGNWPVQLHLLSPHAPYLNGSHLLLCADCVPFAYADFHRSLLPGRVTTIGCPKLDDAAAYLEKLADVLSENDVLSLTVAHMEVPCCFGLVRLAQEALARSGKDMPLRLVKVGIRGAVLHDVVSPRAAAAVR